MSSDSHRRYLRNIGIILPCPCREYFISHDIRIPEPQPIRISWFMSLVGFVCQLLMLLYPKTSSLNGCFRYRWMIPNLYFWGNGWKSPTIKKNGGLPGHWSTDARQYVLGAWKSQAAEHQLRSLQSWTVFCRLAWQQKLGGFLFSSQNLGNWSNLTDIFQMAWNHLSWISSNGSNGWKWFSRIGFRTTRKLP